MYAIIKTGGLQYRVVKDDVIQVPRLHKNPGDEVELNEVMLLTSDDATIIGKPLVDGAKVVAEVLDEARGKKLIIFKMKRRKGYRRKNGHRQWYTELRIKDIVSTDNKLKTESDELSTKSEKSPIDNQ